MIRDFDHLLAPATLLGFVAEYYEKRPFLIRRNQPGYYDDLITIDELNRYLGTADVRVPGLRLIRDGEDLEVSEFTHSAASGAGVVDKNKVFQRLHEGYTILLAGYERHSGGLFRLRHLTERTFEGWSQANIYLTPRQSQGFTPHWDNHDVFILQFAGTKQWSIYDRAAANEEWTAVAPTMTVILQPGDLLYIPKGFVHDARSTDSLSGHVTLGITQHTYADVLRLLVDKIDEAPELRDSLPFGSGTRGVDASQFADRVTRFFARADVPAAVRQLYEQFRNARAADASDGLLDYLRLPALDSTTLLRKKPSLFSDVARAGDEVVLRFHQKTLRFPANTEDSLRQILAGGDFDLASLPGLDEPGKRELIATLVTEGFLTIASS